MSKKLDLTNLETGINAVNLKAAANTFYDSNILDITLYKNFYLQVDILTTGVPTVGQIKLESVIYDKDLGVQFRIEKLLTSISTIVAGVAQLLVREGADPIIGTIGVLEPMPDILKVASKVAIRLTVTIANNGTTSIGSLRFLAAE